MNSRVWRHCLVVSLAAGAGLLWAEDRFAQLSGAVTELRLPNGLLVLSVYRPQSPAVSFHLRVKAGVADEPAGQSGVAMLAERTFGEGSVTLGSKNPAAERKDMEEGEAFLFKLREEDAKGDRADELTKGQLEVKAKVALGQAAANAVQPRFFDAVLERNSATGAGGRVSSDFTDFYATLGSHRAELWFKMTGEWLANPSARFFYQNRTGVYERRLASARTGAAQRETAFAEAAFSGHPYKGLAAAPAEMLKVLEQEAAAFLRRCYGPSNLVLAVVGDLPPAEVKRLAEIHLGKLAARPAPQPRTVEPRVLAESQRMRVTAPEPPVLAAAWLRPAAGSAEDAVFDLLQVILAGGPASRLQRDLIEAQKMAVGAQAISRYPGGRYETLFLLELRPAGGRSPDELEGAMQSAIDDLVKVPVTAAELARAKAWWRTALAEESLTNAGRAAQLARLHSEYGNWHVEERLQRIEAVTEADCRNVAGKYLSGRPHFVVQQMVGMEGSPE